MVLPGLTYTQPVRCRQTRLGFIFWALWVHVPWTKHRGLMLKSHLQYLFDLAISGWCMGRFFISVGASPVSVSFVWVGTLNRSDHSDFDGLQLQVLQSLCSRVGLVMPWPLSQHEWCHWCHEELNNLPRDNHGDNARFRHYGKFSPCDGEHLRSCSFLCGNSGMARGTFVSLCSISKHMVKPWNAQWLMPRGWATCGCVWWVSWGPGWYFKTSDVLVKSQDWQAMSQCYFKRAVPGCGWVRQHSIFEGLKALKLGWSWRIYDGFCQELGRLRGRAAQTSKKPDAWYSTSFRFGASSKCAIVAIAKV